MTDEQPPPEQPFDPYRYGKPDHPIPPEYAPPGYVPDPPPSPQPQPPHPYYGPTPYGSIPPPYGDPRQPGPYPYPYGPRPPQGASGMAIAALVLGILSIVGALFAFLDVLPVVLAVTFGIIVLTSQRPGRGLAIAGLVCAAVGAALAITVTVYLTSAVNKCGGWSHSDDPDFSQCIQDHL